MRPSAVEFEDQIRQIIVCREQVWQRHAKCLRKPLCQIQIRKVYTAFITVDPGTCHELIQSCRNTQAPLREAGRGARLP